MSDEPPNLPPKLSLSSYGGPFGRIGSARPQGSPYPKAELLPRLLARLTDLMLAAIFPLSLGRPGAIFAVLFLLFADGLFRGQSPGKKLLGVRAVLPPGASGADYRESALRNCPLALALALALLPGLGKPWAAGLGLALALFEGWQAFSDKLGLRLGDLLAGTQVVDAKVAVGEIARPSLRLVRSQGGVRGAARALLAPPGARES